MSSQGNSSLPSSNSSPGGAGPSCGPRKRGRECTTVLWALHKPDESPSPAEASQAPCSNTSSRMERPDPRRESETPVPIFDSLSKGCGFNRPRSDYWGTPIKLKEQLAQHMNLRFSGFDPAPYPQPPGFNGLNHIWKHGAGETIFVNPPFSDMPSWIAKMIAEASRGKSILALLPHQSDRAWYESVLDAAKSIVFIRGKVNYINLLTGKSPRGGAPFPVFAVHFDNKKPGEHIKGTLAYTVLWPKQRPSGTSCSP